VARAADWNSSDVRLCIVAADPNDVRSRGTNYLVGSSSTLALVRGTRLLFAQELTRGDVVCPLGGTGKVHRPACKPSATVLHLGRSLPSASSDQPGGRKRTWRPAFAHARPPIFGLAPGGGGATLCAAWAGEAVRKRPSPLPTRRAHCRRRFFPVAGWSIYKLYRNHLDQIVTVCAGYLGNRIRGRHSSVARKTRSKWPGAISARGCQNVRPRTSRKE